MLQDDKELLLKDLCARLLYDTFISVNGNIETLIGLEYGESYIDDDTISKTPQFTTEGHGGRRFARDIEEIKPYLRPMSSMTEEEIIKYNDILHKHNELLGEHEASELIDWLISRHFDYRWLIEKGLAIEAPEGMYK